MFHQLASKSIASFIGNGELFWEWKKLKVENTVIPFVPAILSCFEVPDWKQCVASTVCNIALNTTVNCNVLLHLKSCCFIPHPICLSEPELGSETRLFINADKQKCFSSLKISTLTRCFKTPSSLCVVRTIQDRLETEENKWRWNWHHCFSYLN